MYSPLQVSLNQASRVQKPSKGWSWRLGAEPAHCALHCDNKGFLQTEEWRTVRPSQRRGAKTKRTRDSSAGAPHLAHCALKGKKQRSGAQSATPSAVAPKWSPVQRIQRSCAGNWRSERWLTWQKRLGEGLCRTAYKSRGEEEITIQRRGEKEDSREDSERDWRADSGEKERGVTPGELLGLLEAEALQGLVISSSSSLLLSFMMFMDSISISSVIDIMSS